MAPSPLLASAARCTGLVSVVALSRVGYIAKGLVFVAIGLLSLLTVFGMAEGQVTGSDGAIVAIGSHLPGRLGFGLLVTGLGAHVFWRLYQAIMDPDRKGRSPVALAKRIGFLISATFYATLMLVALSAITGLTGSGDWADTIGNKMVDNLPGRMALGLIGSGFVGTGLYQLLRAWQQPFRDRWMTQGGLVYLHGPMAWLSSIGIAIRAVLFVMLGWQLVRAGWFAERHEIMDMAATLWRISTETWGDKLLGITATGLICYGIYCLFNAAFRRIEAVPARFQDGQDS